MATHGSIYSLLKRLDAIGTGDIAPIKLPDKLQIVHEQVRRHLEQAHKKYASQYNLRARERKFVIGQELFRRNFIHSKAAEGFNSKLADQFVKCRIAKKIGSSMYEIEDMQGKPVGTYHAKDLRT